MFTGLRSRETEERGEVDSQEGALNPEPERQGAPCALCPRLGFAATYIGARLAYCDRSASASCGDWPRYRPWNVLISPSLSHWFLGRMGAGLTL